MPTDYGQMDIKIEVRGQKPLQTLLASLPRGVTKAVIAAYAAYLIGNERRGLRYYPPRVTHGESNPYQWQSDRQRRAYFASNGFGGGIPYQRTNALQKGWESEARMDGYQTRIYNRVPYADFVQGVIQQRGHWADKWRKWRDIISTNTAGALQAARRAADKVIGAVK